ncbi:MAG: HlyD family efflux transporter periplasmic adaptor subunit [Hyphomonadaceae bacterium]|nr:HlyD family efflux transporter periplasmic adaptor subunit [Hyphomonadaceae bacterium]
MADDIRHPEPEAETRFADVDDIARAVTRRHDLRRRLLLGLGGLVTVALIGIGLYWAFIGSHYVSTDNAYVGASTAQISAQVSGLVKETAVSETQPVRKGDLLVVIDPADAELAVARADAEYRQTLQRVQQYYAEESAAAAQAASRQADVERARLDFERRDRLASTGAVSDEELTAARATRDAATANLAAARQALAARRALTHGATVDNHPESLAARAALDAARLDLARTRIIAPIDGVVVQNHVQIGQKVEPGARLMGIAPLAQAYVDANFKEVQLRRMRVGQPVRLTSDLYGDGVVFHGRVAGLGGGTGSAFAIIPAQNATGNWIKVVQRVPVRITLDPSEVAAHPLRVGLSMRAVIDVSR